MRGAVPVTQRVSSRGALEGHSRRLKLTRGKLLRKRGTRGKNLTVVTVRKRLGMKKTIN